MFFFLLFIHDLLFSPRIRYVESKGRFMNLFGNFGPLCGGVMNLTKYFFVKIALHTR